MSNHQSYTFGEHDKLNRKPFADFLLSLIEHRNEYRRPDSANAYSIAIDAVYGSGKTRFLKMFESMVKDVGGYNVAYYSAWEHDLYDDALAPILSLLDRPANVLGEQAYSRMEKTLGLKALHVLKRIGASYISMKAKKQFGDEYEEIINDVKSIFGQEASEPDAYDIRMKCISELQHGLESATENAPLIFIIDELDRCNPSFAIKTLEVAKHLLDVKNVIFIFALDMHQMRAAVKKFYGQDIDADGYLCKVFDYFTFLPAPSDNKYILQCIQSIDPEIKRMAPDFVEFAVQTIRANNCTLRFIDTFIASFRVAWHSFVQKYDNSYAYILYFYALFLKYRYPKLFLLTTQHLPLSEEDKTNLKMISFPNAIVESYADNCTNTIGIAPKSFHSRADSFEINKFYLNENGKIIFGKPNVARVSQDLTPDDSINYILYSPDIMRYEEIKNLTYGQFIHRQLEMYNPFPSEKPEQ